MVFLIGLFVSGCTYTSERSHPQFPSYRQPMGVMLVSLPEIRIFQHFPDGSRLFQTTQSQDAQRHAQGAIVRQFQSRRFTVRMADAQVMQQLEYSGITSLFRSVNRSIQLHTFGPQLFPAKLSAFEYNLGPVSEILKAHEADGLVLAIGHQTGSERPTDNWLSIAVVEPEGRIIWYGLQGNPQKFNLLNAEGMSTLVSHTMINLWEQGS